MDMQNEQCNMRMLKYTNVYSPQFHLVNQFTTLCLFANFMCVVVEIYILIYLSSCFTVTDSSVLKYISISLLSGPG